MQVCDSHYLNPFFFNLLVILLQMMTSQEASPNLKEISSVIDSLKKQVASRRCISIKVHLYGSYVSVVYYLVPWIFP